MLHAPVKLPPALGIDTSSAQLMNETERVRSVSKITQLVSDSA
jgi:hypothetical protein